MPHEILTLTGSHGLIRSNRPSNLPLEAIDRVMKESTEEQLENFGLFDSGSPNYYTYYPDVTEADMNPTDNDFVYPVYRLISKVIISPKNMAVDFTNGNCLKESMHLLVGQSIFLDHEAITGSVMGVVQSTYWQESYKVGDKVIPAGINGVLKIDAKSNPRVARAIMMDPPSIHSTSVTISFGWEKSHARMDDNEFYNKLGTFEKDGKRVSKKVNSINLYLELSLVPHGADPFAKKVKDGKIVMAEAASKMYQMSLSADQIKREPYMIALQGSSLAPYQMATMSFSDANSFDTTNSNINNNNKEDKMFEKLLQTLGLSLEQIPDEAALTQHILDSITSTETLSARVTELEGEVETLTATEVDLNTQIADLTAKLPTAESLSFIEDGKAHLAAVRDEALRFYRLTKGDKPNAAIEASISEATLSNAQAFLAEYESQYNEAVPLRCEDCNSEKVSRKVGEKDTPPKQTLQNTREAVIARKQKESIGAFLKK